MSVEYERVKFEKSGVTAEFQKGLVEELCLEAFQHLEERGVLDPLTYGLQVDEEGDTILLVISLLVAFLSTKSNEMAEMPLFQLETAFYIFKKMFPELQDCVELTVNDLGARFTLTRH